MNASEIKIKNVRQSIDRIFDLWQLTSEERDKLLPRHTLDETSLRMGYILGIYKALHMLLPNNDHADTWIKKPNAFPMYEGHSALEYIMKHDVIGLKNVRAYLDSQCYGG